MDLVDELRILIRLKRVTYLYLREQRQYLTVDMNQPGIQTWLQEMKDRSLSKYDIMTVGEANGVSPDDADDWVG